MRVDQALTIGASLFRKDNLKNLSNRAGLSLSIFCLSAFANMAPAKAYQPGMEVYGDLPTIRGMQISPNGEKLGYLLNAQGSEGLVIFDPKTKKSGGMGTDKIKANYMFFPNSDFAILTASQTNTQDFSSQYEQSAAFSFNIKTNRTIPLLRQTENVNPTQSLSRIVGIHKGKNEVFMPAYYGERAATPRRHLMRVNLATGGGRIHKRGLLETIDWFVDSDGTVLAREDYDNERDIYRLFTYDERGKSQLVFKETNVKQVPITIYGFKKDRSAFVIRAITQGSDYVSLYEMDLKGKLTKEIFGKPDRDISRPLTDQNRFVIGVEYEGLYPTYEFFDDNLTNLVKQIQDSFQGLAVSLVDWTEGFDKLVFKIEGGLFAPGYYMYDQAQGGIIKIADTYPIKAEDVADVLTITYPARDGLKIPSVVTRPANWSPDKKYPLIAMPHGGPEAYDSVRFDWMAQYFARRGYIVLQPNFRGSTGFGLPFRNAGRGEWGQKMQDDITDGVKALEKLGWVDMDRVCIAGASYGGYAALAGGAFTPDLYQCVVAIAPVSDLPRMLRWEIMENGRDSWVNEYWRKVIGDRKEEEDKLIAISPARNAEKFKAPVLLIHGNQDTVVPYSQTEHMASALKRAKKAVEVEKLKGGDHWLSKRDTRMETLRAMATFIESHIGEK